MENDNIVIREAAKGDAEIVATVVSMALGGEPKEHKLYPIFEELAARENAQYSYKNALVATLNGELAGAVVGYDGARLEELRAPLLALIREQFGEPLNIENETSAGEFYVDSLAVMPKYRGRGLGRRLLVAICNKAFEAGYERVGLLVDFKNPGAERLYSSLGFKRVNETTFLGIPMWHMQCCKECFLC